VVGQVIGVVTRLAGCDAVAFKNCKQCFDIGTKQRSHVIGQNRGIKVR